MTTLNNIYKLPFVSPNLLIQDNVVVVGSSSSILNMNGQDIDSFDTVIRFNRAPTIGYENFVGIKTSLRVLNNHVFDNINIQNRGYSDQPQKFIKKIKNSEILRVGRHQANHKKVKEFNKKNNIVYFFDYKKIPELKKLVGYKSENNMSVGTVCISLLLVSEININVVGFDLDMRNTTHYWETRPNKMSKYHDQSYEKKWLKNLVDEKLINVIN